jgi:hypothetical protein
MRRSAQTTQMPISTKRPASAPLVTRTTARTSLRRIRPIEEKNVAPSQWGRRLARLVGAKFNVQMSLNQSKNEGTWRRKDIVIKCAKSTMPPVSILVDMLERIDQLWAVYVMPDGGAEIWAVDAHKVRLHGYFTHGPNVAKRVEIHLRKIMPIGKLIGTLSADEVESCRIP